MALIDFLQQAETITGPKAPSVIETPLVSADSELARAKQNQELRVKREELQRRIDNLRAQKEQLEARKKEIKENSLSNTPEDKIVAIAKAKGIKDEDIDMWLRGRTARTNREISQGQKEELGRQAEAEAKKATAIEKANKEARKQAILDARNAYEKANKPVEPEEYESKVSELDSLEFTFNNLKDSYEKDYKEKLDFTLTPRKVQATSADGAPKDGKIPPIPAGVELTADQRREWNKPTTTKDQRDKIIAQIIDKKKAEVEEKEKKIEDAKKKRSDIESEAKGGKFSNKKKRNMAVDYCDTFRDAGEVPPKLADAWKILFNEEMPITK